MNFTEAARIEEIVNLATSLSPSISRRNDPESNSARLDLSERDLRRYSIVSAIESIRPSMKAAGLRGAFEAECSQALSQRGFQVPLGAIAVPMDVLERRSLPTKYFVGVSAPESLSFIDLLRNRSVLYRLGARRIPDLRNDVGVPRQTSGSTVTWVAIDGSVTAQDAAFGQVSATQKTAVAITDVSEQLLRQSAAEDIISSSLAADVAVGFDAAGISGVGGREPLGIINTPGIGTASGASLGYTGLVGVQKTVADLNAIIDPKSTGYVTTPTVAELLKGRQRFTGTDSPLWRGALLEGEIEGVRAFATKQVPASTLVYGDFSTLALCEWGPLMLSANNSGTRFNQAQVGIRALWMVDVIVTAPSAFVKVTGIT